MYIYIYICIFTEKIYIIYRQLFRNSFATLSETFAKTTAVQRLFSSEPRHQSSGAGQHQRAAALAIVMMNAMTNVMMNVVMDVVMASHLSRYHINIHICIYIYKCIYIYTYVFLLKKYI